MSLPFCLHTLFPHAVLRMMFMSNLCFGLSAAGVRFSSLSGFSSPWLFAFFSLIMLVWLGSSIDLSARCVRSSWTPEVDFPYGKKGRAKTRPNAAVAGKWEFNEAVSLGFSVFHRVCCARRGEVGSQSQERCRMLEVGRSCEKKDT